MRRWKKNVPFVLPTLLVLLLLGIMMCCHFNPWPISKKETTVVEVTSRQNTASATLKIDKIKVLAPIIPDIDPSDEVKYDQALKEGVLLMPKTGKIGEVGNAVIYGHSSSNLIDAYSSIFAKLNDLKPGDKIDIEKGGKEYDYSVTGKKIVDATDLSVIDQTQDQTLTIITCWPIGTDNQRLIVVAKR